MGNEVTPRDHPVDVLKHYWPTMPPEREAELRAICDEPVPWPDWCDLGKRVEVVYADGTTAQGVLAYDDMTPGPDEAPLFYVRKDDGTQTSFFDHKTWRFIAP